MQTTVVFYQREPDEITKQGLARQGMTWAISSSVMPGTIYTFNGRLRPPLVPDPRPKRRWWRRLI